MNKIRLTAQPSECKLNGTANDQASKTILEYLLEKNKIEVVFIDLEDKYWQNYNDTAVLQILKGDAAAWGEIVSMLRPDEYQRYGKTIRMWWD